LSWSVNPERLIEQEERGTATLQDRLNAAKTAVAAGYKVGFHFDPIIFSEKWEDEYRGVAEKIMNGIPHEKIAWISMGTLRFPHQMKDVAAKRFPRSKIFFNELVPVNGKVRYFRPIREAIYRKMFEWLSPLSGTAPIYLCMETKPVWSALSKFKLP
jgi:spore photoproduct lyase